MAATESRSVTGPSAQESAQRWVGREARRAVERRGRAEFGLVRANRRDGVGARDPGESLPGRAGQRPVPIDTGRRRGQSGGGGSASAGRGDRSA